jgi:hypothetical protein
MHKRIFSCQLSEMNDEIKFRCLTLEDEIWIQETFPNYKDEMTTESVDMGILSAIAYRCAINKDLFAEIEREVYDDAGVKNTIKVGGLELFREGVKHQSDQTSLMIAFAEICNKSRPLNESPVKKKMRLSTSILCGLLTACVLAIIGLIAR